MASESVDAGSQHEPQPLLELRGVSKFFDGLPAVKQLDFAVRHGEIVGIIGPNGAGKTTMIGLVSGSLPLSSGQIRYRGLDISRLPPHRRAHLGIARTFQVTQPFKGLSVRENVMIGALFGRRGLKQTAAREAADAVLERVGLAAKAHFRADQLTVADRKRLELARALALEPELLLLDEVMAGLTPTEVEQAIALIRAIHASGVTVLVIEHVMQAIMGLSQRIMVLHQGSKIAEGPPEQVLADQRVIEAYLGERYAREQQSRLGAARSVPQKDGKEEQG
ncbi:MAG: ABC transporter ATP-binding protein [Thermogemmatispora sp.]|uniref:ABC transporter ATP-binding protein n=1 Tax=Thermogemmatispora sp. TaxID=1968838 RepID=UPI00343ECABC|nr:ABC transporter ATP-binding protein [Thermogemmatispora sp.]